MQDPIIVNEISEHTDQEQAELIADNFSKISNQYNALCTSVIKVPFFSQTSIPHITQAKVEQAIKQIKTKASTPPGDIPAKNVKILSKSISIPLTNILNSCITKGEWPNIWKEEAVTPIPKVHPPKEIDDLRSTSGLKNLNKVAEKIFAEMMLNDMKEKLDKSQL